MFLAIVLILTRLFNISLAPIPPYVAEYSTHVIEFLMSRQPGTFYCLFYDLSHEFPTNSVFDDLLRTPRLDNVVKYVLDSWFVTNFYVPIPQKPSLVVVYVGESSIPNTVRLMFLILNPNTKVLVLVNSRWFEPIREMINILADRTDGGRVFNKVVYIVAPLTIFHTDLEGRIRNVLRDFPHPQVLFKDNLLDMQGSPIVYSWTDGAVAGDIIWIKESAKYLNATARYEEHLCNRIRAPDCKTKHQFDPNSTILLDHLILAELSPPAYQTLFVVLPDTTVIVVPRGRTINVIEMFLWPFSLEVWSILAGSLIAAELISLIFPWLLKNDPILLVLCGFERASLHRSTKWEKLIMLSMIVFFFFMKSAYETRIISYMAQKPSLREIKTVRELVQAGIQIVVNPIRNPYLKEDDEIGSLVVHRQKDMGYDGISAYVGGGRNVEYLLGLPYLYDYQLGRRKYYALQETRGVKVPMFLLFNRALLEHFSGTQRVFFESGLIFKWDQDEARLTRTADRRFYFRMHVKVNVDGLLKIDDLLPAWIALAAGSTISCAVFVVEIAIKRAANFDRYWSW